MKKISSFAFILSVGSLIACSSAPKPVVKTAPAPVKKDSSLTAVPDKNPLKTDEQRYSYALGMNMGHALVTKVNVPLDTKLLVAGLRGQLDTSLKVLMTEQQADSALQNMVAVMQIQDKKLQVAKSKKALDDQKAFLAMNAKDSSVITTKSGLQYKIIKNSTGISPKATDKVRVHYVGTLLDGTEFDNSIKSGKPLEFPVNAVIRGWQELLQLMKEGMEVKAWIPSSLGYGEVGAPPAISGNSLLIFDIQLLKVLAEPAPTDSSKATAESAETKDSTMTDMKAATPVVEDTTSEKTSTQKAASETKKATTKASSTEKAAPKAKK